MKANLVINPSYQKLLTDKNFIIACKGSAGSGKSVFFAQMALIKLLQFHNEGKPFTCLVLRKTGRSIKDSVLAEFKRVISDMGIGRHFRIISNPPEITKGDCKIIFSGLDDPEKIKSISRPNIIWMEEATEFTYEDFSQLKLRLRGAPDEYLQMWVTFNPISDKHWLKIALWDKQPENATLLTTTYKDNKFVDERYAALLEEYKSVDLNYYRVYALGEWGSDPKGLVYQHGTDYEIYSKELEEYDDIAYGLDFGYNHPMALVRCAWKGNDVYVREAFYESGRIIEDVIRRLKELKVKHSTPIYCDSANPDDIQRIRSEGYNAIKADKSIESGLRSCKSYNLYIHEDSNGIIKELGLYKWKEKPDKMAFDRNYDDKVVPLFDDGLDAMRYAIHTHRAKGVPKIW